MKNNYDFQIKSLKDEIDIQKKNIIKFEEQEKESQAKIKQTKETIEKQAKDYEELNKKFNEVSQL